MRVAVAGSSGFLGTALLPRLRARGPEEVTWRPGEAELDPAALAGVDTVINLAGVGVGDRRWNPGYQALIRSSRVESTVTLARAVAAARAAEPDRPRPATLINASAVGYYGDTGDRATDETQPAGSGFVPGVCQAWESAAEPARQAGTRVVFLRTGLVLGPRGGLLGSMLPLFRAGLGGRLGTGRQWMPWISLADVLGAIEFLLGTDAVCGPVNLTGPAPVRNAELTRTLGAVLHRPARLPVPAAAMRLALGGFANEVLASLRVVPRVLTGAGYEFQHPDLESALRWALSR